MSPLWWCVVTYVLDAVTYVTYVVVRVPMSRMWWHFNLCHLCGGVRSPMWWCAVTYVTYVVVRVPMSRMWWHFNLCHLCGGVWSPMSPMWWRLILCHLCGGVCPYFTHLHGDIPPPVNTLPLWINSKKDANQTRSPQTQR